MSERLSIVIPVVLKEEIEELTKLLKDDKSSLIRRILKYGIEEERIKIAIELYIQDKVSMGKAAEVAKVSLWRFFDELHKRNIPLNYKLEDAKREIAEILKRE